MDELNKSHIDDVEHRIETVFDKVVTIPVMTDGKDSGVAIYVGLTNIGKFAIGPVSDQRVLDIAGRISLTGRCLPSGNTGKAVHAHDDGTWWFWDETWATEHGPYISQEIAEIAVDEYAKSL